MRLFARWLALLVLILASPALAQSVPLQGGPWAAGHAPMYSVSGGTQPIIQDSGTAAGGALGSGLNELGLTVRSSGTAPFANAGTGPNHENLCDYDAPTTNATGGHYVCLSPNAQGGALISTGTFGTATPQPLQFMINGALSSPATITGYSSGKVVCFSTTAQTVVPCPNTTGTGNLVYSTAPAIAGAAISGGTVTGLTAPLPVASGGTGVVTLPALSAAMGLGTMSTQNATAVAITGGAITGLPNPSVSADAATKGYVDSVATGLNPLAASNLVTVAALPTNTYANGTLGVGATLTATVNGALSVDSVAVTVGQRVIVNNEVTASHNGIYTVTATGDGSNPYVLTRATDFDQAAEMLKNSYSFVQAGATETGTSWILSATVTTVGTTSVNFVLFNTQALPALANTKIFVGSAGGVATAQTVSGDATLANTGALTVTKTNGTSFAASATTDTTVATNVTSGTLAAARLPAFGSGDVSFASGGGAGTIAANAVTNAKAAQMATLTIKGNNTGGTANALDLTAAQTTAMLTPVVGDSGAGGTQGLVPAPAAGDTAAGKFLKADGTWTAPSNGSGETLLATLTPTSGLTSTANGLATTYNQFLIVYQNVVGSGSNNRSLQVAVSSDNGSTFDSAQAVSAGAGGTVSGGTTIYNVGTTATTKVIANQTWNSTGAGYGGIGAQTTKTGLTNALQFSWVTGLTFVSGNILIYGVK